MEMIENDWNDKTFRSNYMKQYNTKYYQNKKDMLCSKIECECGKMVNLSSLKRHIETPYHKKHLLSIEEQMTLMKNKMLMK